MLEVHQKDLINIINNSSKLIGTRQVLKAIINGTVDKVIIATNVDEVLSNKVKGECSNHNIPMIREFTMSELGKLCGIDVGCAVVGLKIVQKWIFLRGCNGNSSKIYKEEK